MYCMYKSFAFPEPYCLCENIRPYMAGLQVIVINIRSRLGVFLDILLRGDDKAHKAAARGSDISNAVLFQPPSLSEVSWPVSCKKK